VEADIACENTLSPSQMRMQRRVVRVCEATGEFIAWWGFKSIHGRIWALLALSRDPVSQAELSRTLGVSRALVSGAIAELLEYGLVRPRSGDPWLRVPISRQMCPSRQPLRYNIALREL